MIVCATRGGEGSRASQQAAVKHAQEIGDLDLVFLYVVDDKQLSTYDTALHVPLRQEMVWLADTLMTLAHNRAENLGVTAKTIVLQGGVKDQIIAYLRENDTDWLFVGSPRDSTSNIFGDDEIEKLALEIEGATKTKVVITRPHEITN